jgi:hypothetical protein
MLEVRNSDIHGRGCFATVNIGKGALLTFPVILVDKQDSCYLFPWSGDTKSIVIGPVTFCNSSDTPNLRIKSIDREKLTKTFETLDDINIGDELLLNYMKKDRI